MAPPRHSLISLSPQVPLSPPLFPPLFVPITQDLAGFTLAPCQNFPWNMIKTKALGLSCLLTIHYIIFLFFLCSFQTQVSQAGSKLASRWPLYSCQECFLIAWPPSSMDSGSSVVPLGKHTEASRPLECCLSAGLPSCRAKRPILHVGAERGSMGGSERGQGLGVQDQEQ